MFKTLMVMRALSGAFEPTRVNLCSAEGDPPPDGGNQPPPPKTFTQADLTRIAAKEKADGERAGKAAAEAEFKAKEAEHLKRIEELELAGKTQAERDAHERKQREEADKKARESEKAQLAKERDEATAKANAAEARWKADRINTAVTSALLAANVLQSAAADAAYIFVRDAKIETDDDGQITNVIYAGQSYAKIETAAKAFLKERSHLAQAAGTGGTGSRLPGSAGGSGAGGPTDAMSREELLAGASAERAARDRR